MNNKSDIPFLQSPPWQAFQQALGRKTFFKQTANWSFLAILETSKFNRRLYVPYGPVFKTKNDLKIAINELKQLARQQKVDFIRIEPASKIADETLRSLNFKKVDFLQLQPKLTQVINLDVSTEQLLTNMSQNNRNIYRNYAKKGLSIRSSRNPADIKILIKLLQKVAQHNKIKVHHSAYFEKQAQVLFPLKAAKLLIAEFDNQPIAAVLLFDSKTTRTYAHAAADYSFRKLSAGNALLAEAIIDAKKQGLRTFDLFGITNSTNPQHRWAGFTKFKKSFGGHTLERGGIWDLPLNKLAYLVYKNYQKARHKLS